MKQKRNVFYYIVLSIIAAFLVLAMAYLIPSENITLFDKLFVGGAFITSCIFGISIAINPGWFRRFTKHIKKNINSNQKKKRKMKYKGHHPSCGKFQNHIIDTKNKSYCAGCIGLEIGSIISIFSIIIYIVSDMKSTNMFQILIIFGLILIGLAYAEIMIPKRYAIIHVISNILLVIGLLIVTISIFEITGNKIYGMMGVTLSFLWLDTRVQLSSWQHNRICSNCNESCKIY